MGLTALRSLVRLAAGQVLNRGDLSGQQGAGEWAVSNDPNAELAAGGDELVLEIAVQQAPLGAASNVSTSFLPQHCGWGAEAEKGRGEGDTYTRSGCR